MDVVSSPSTRVKGSNLVTQLWSQLDDFKVGDKFSFQPDFDGGHQKFFSAIFYEEVTLERIAIKMQVSC